MKKIDFAQMAKTVDGKGVNLQEGGKACTWGEVVFNALMYPSKKIMEACSVADKRAMYSIAARIFNFPTNTSLSEDEIEMVRLAMGEKFMPGIVGAFEEFLFPPKPELKAVHEEQAGER